MIAAAAICAVFVLVCVLAGLLLGGMTFWPALGLAWLLALIAFGLLVLVGAGAEMSDQWRER